MMVNLLRDNGAPISDLKIEEIKQLPVWETLSQFGTGNLFFTVFLVLLFGVAFVTVSVCVVLHLFGGVLTLYNTLKTKYFRLARSMAYETVWTHMEDTKLVRNIAISALIAYVPFAYFMGTLMAEKEAVRTVNIQMTREALAEHYELSEETVQDILPKDEWYEAIADRTSPVTLTSAENITVPTTNSFVVLSKVLVIQDGKNLTLHAMENDLSPSIPINEAIQKLEQE